MFEANSMMETNYLLEKALDTSTLRGRVIANNIANVDVPHFKRSEVDFESELSRAIEERDSKRAGQFPAKMTDPRHIPFDEPRGVRSVQPRVNLDYSTSYRNDGNNVDIEREIVDSNKNTMVYNSAVSSISQNIKIMKMVMRSA
ncbi:MAG: flagellar basal body rod protein FlgB [Spirochaetota bacterium]